jgi:hypothetical protein
MSLCLTWVKNSDRQLRLTVNAASMYSLIQYPLQDLWPMIRYELRW